MNRVDAVNATCATPIPNNIAIRGYERMCDSMCDRAHTCRGSANRHGSCLRRRRTPVPSGAMARRRIDTLLAERGLSSSRSSAADSVRAGRVRIGGDGPVALRPSQLVPEDADLRARRATAIRLARGREARQCAGRPGDRRRGPGLPRRRSLDGRLHRLPAAARGGPGDRARRRVRPARLAPARGRARERGRAGQRALARTGCPAVPPAAHNRRRLVHLAREGAPRPRRLPPGRRRDPRPGQAAVRAREGAGGEGRRRALGG